MNSRWDIEELFIGAIFIFIFFTFIVGLVSCCYDRRDPNWPPHPTEPLEANSKIVEYEIEDSVNVGIDMEGNTNAAARGF